MCNTLKDKHQTDCDNISLRDFIINVITTLCSCGGFLSLLNLITHLFCDCDWTFVFLNDNILTNVKTK